MSSLIGVISQEQATSAIGSRATTTSRGRDHDTNATPPPPAGRNKRPRLKTSSGPPSGAETTVGGATASMDVPETTTLGPLVLVPTVSCDLAATKGDDTNNNDVTECCFAAGNDDYLSHLQTELLMTVTEYVGLKTLPRIFAVAAISRLFRQFVYSKTDLWRDLNLMERQGGTMIPTALQGRFKDDDLRRLLRNTNAREVTRSIRVMVGGGLSGDGLALLAGSRALQKVEIFYVRGECSRRRQESSAGGDSDVVQLLDSFIPQGGAYYRGEESSFRLQRVELLGWSDFGKQEERTAQMRLYSRMKTYWSPPSASCSHCACAVKQRELSSSNNFSGEYMAETSQNWLCILCSRATCGRGSCPKVTKCATGEHCFLQGPICSLCTDDMGLEKCHGCDRDVCRDCADDNRCSSCGTGCCDRHFSGEGVTGHREGTPACEKQQCPCCRKNFCSDAKKCLDEVCGGCSQRVCKSCNSAESKASSPRAPGDQAFCRFCDEHGPFSDDSSELDEYACEDEPGEDEWPQEPDDCDEQS